MKYEIIKTKNYLLIVDDSEIKEGDWVFNNISKEIYQFIENYVSYEKKIIAHLPLNNAFEIEGVDLLPPIEDEVIALAEESFEGFDGCTESDKIIYINGYTKGYNRAKNECKYSEKDVIRIVEKSRETGLTAEYLMLSLQQTKYPVAFELETINCSQGITQWVGKYIY